MDKQSFLERARQTADIGTGHRVLSHRPDHRRRSKRRDAPNDSQGASPAELEMTSALRTDGAES